MSRKNKLIKVIIIEWLKERSRMVRNYMFKLNINAPISFYIQCTLTKMFDSFSQKIHKISVEYKYISQMIDKNPIICQSVPIRSNYRAA